MLFALYSTNLCIFSVALKIRKNSQLIKKVKLRLKIRNGYENCYQHYYNFLKQSKSVKLGLENINTGYYQVTEVFKSVLNIQQHAGSKNDRN